ncbi:MAG: GNAT family N-acetyltransferase [Paucibacter sp.]|nr:GNAT family N-acetyltransferase [Roseateles sp.]
MLVRPMLPQDSAAVSELLPHLGYQANRGEVADRFSAMLACPDNVAFVAELEGQIVGLCQVHGVRLLASNGYAEVGALVVHPECQRKGVGAALVQDAESWATQQGYERLRLRSGVHREEAHLFYIALGFSKSRASYAFERSLGTNAG